MINPKHKLFQWGPIDGVPIYPDYWFLGFVHFKKNYPPGWPQVLMYSYDRDKFLAIIDYEELYASGETVFKNHLLNDKNFQKNYQLWSQLTDDLRKFFARIEKEKITKNNIAQLFSQWSSLNGSRFWNVGCVPEVGNWGGEQIFARELKKKIKNESEFNRVFERLSAPEDFSFYQLEELDLFSLKTLSGKKLDDALKKHQRKYFWLMNNYHDTRVLPVSYFKKRLAKESLSSAKKKIEEIKLHIRTIKKEKEEIFLNYRLSKQLQKMSKRFSFSIWWQDARKAYIFECNHVVDVLLKNIARLYQQDFDDLHYYLVPELADLITIGTTLEKKEIQNRKKHFVEVWDGKKTFHYSGEPALEIIKPYLVTNIDSRIDEFKGMVVNSGKVKGRAKILKSAKEVGKMKKGDVLVAAMTSPEYIVALRKAAAVVTDHGGMTCHAAIVSRELKIPGIVATRIATKVLKDGDLIEVDANKGIIKIIK